MSQNHLESTFLGVDYVLRVALSDALILEPLKDRVLDFTILLDPALFAIILAENVDGEDFG